MAIFKCKMCGGNIDFVEGDTIGVCDSCGTKQTLPKATDEAVSSLFNRANALRLKSEFDRAAELYNKIISVDETQAEAYWGLILCKYGIEYVEDPKTFKRVPTCHRASFDAVTADEDFRLAVKHADSAQKALYQSEAKAIDDIQKDILKIAANEKPFDVFICYKETDNYGRRTQDSVTANEIYHQLTQAGYKVFYSAITLEDKLGQEYEPYIFAALNSAKVMLVIGSKPEYFTAVWVKNEWSRFLKLMSNDRSKLLIPCYKDMDAYDLPDDFAHLQAQDMSKIGFINDVIRGIKKVVNREDETPKKTVVVNNTQTGSNIVALKKRGFMALEDGEWQKADGFFEDALNQDAEDAECYLGKLMINLKVGKRENLKNFAQPFDNNQNYVKACRFDKKIEKELNEYLDTINEEKRKIEEERRKVEEKRKNAIYTDALDAMNSAKTISDYKKAAKLFKTISTYKDAYTYAQKCIEIAKKIKNSLPICNISAKNHTVALKSDGTVIAIGNKKHGQCKVFEWNDIVAVSAGDYHTIGLKSDGTVVAVGCNWFKDYGQCDVSSWKNIVAVSAGEKHTVGLKSDGTVVAVGDNKYGQCKVSDWKNIVAVSAGGYHTVGLKSDGTVITTRYGKDYGYSGQCDVFGWKDIVAVSAGWEHTVGLKSDGTVVATDFERYDKGDIKFYSGQCDVSKWRDIVAVSAGAHHTVGLKTDGTVVAVGFKKGGSCNVSSWKDIVAVSAGIANTLGIKSDGTLAVTGENYYGQSDVKDWKDIKTTK